MPGYKHTPQNDIDNIRDLLRGYGNADTILKELIQNAEDANASSVEFLYVANEPGRVLPHPLLNGPALCMVNDGDFTPADQNAIFQIGSGTKASDDRKIGRFGKGLKSAHALSEAYFLIASDKTTEDSSWKGENLWLMNPYGDWRHKEWEEDFGSYHSNIRSHCLSKLAAFGWKHDQKWLSFWFPLRRQSHLKDAQGPVRPIHVWGDEIESQPGDDPDFPQTLKNSFGRLPWRILLLHRLQNIGFASDAPQINEQIAFNEGSIRPTNPHDLEGSECLNGTVVAGNTIDYHGIAGLLEDEIFEELHAKDGWPQAADPTGSSDSISVKGTSHFACVFSDGLGNEQIPKLRIQWAVFLPINDQPDARTLPELDSELWPKGICLTLHGCFFLDSTRSHIDGLAGEGFEYSIENFDANRVGANKVTLEWNQKLASQGPLAHLPEALKQFIEGNEATDAAIRNLIGAIRETWTWKRYSGQITAKHFYLRRVIQGNPSWELFSAEISPLLVPVPEGMDPERVWDLLPGLNNLHNEYAIIHSIDPEGGLFLEDQFHTLDADLLLQLLSEVNLSTREDRIDFIRWLVTISKDVLNSPEVIEALEQFSILQLCSLHDRHEEVWMNHQQVAYALQQEQVFQPTGESELFCRLLTSRPPIWTLAGHLYIDGKVFHPIDLLPVSVPSIGPSEVARWINQEEVLPEEIEPRIKMILWFNMRANLAHDLIVRRAVRYLLHRNYQHRNNLQDSLLYAKPGAQDTIWGKCLQFLFTEVGMAAGWRMLDHNFVQQINNPALLEDLKVHGIDAQGTLAELNTHADALSRLNFDPSTWSLSEISHLLSGLYGADRFTSIPILRRLPVHSINGNGNAVRQPIGEGDGTLEPATFLDVPHFDQEFPEEVQEEWESLLVSLRIVERLPSGDIAETAQRELFREGQTFRELTWPKVIGHVLNQDHPSRYIRLILHGLQVAGGAAMTGLGDRLKSERLLETQDRPPFSFNQIYHIKGLETELQKIFENKAEVITWDILPDWLQGHKGFSSNLNSLIPQTRAVFRAVAEEFRRNSHWWLGLSEQLCPLNEFNLAKIDPLAACASLPVVHLLKQLYTHKPGDLNDTSFWQIFYHAVVQTWPKGDTDRRLRLLSELRQSNNRDFHDLYLKQLGQDDLLPQIISAITLLNQRGEWKPTTELIWPTAGPDKRYLLHPEHNDILASYFNTISGQGTTHPQSPTKVLDQQQLPNRVQNAKELIAYLESIRDQFPEQTENYPILAASLIAVCFEDDILRAYAEDCLRQDGREFETIRDQLFHGNGAGASVFNHLWNSGIFVFQFQDPQEATYWETVAGGTLALSIDDNIPHLLVQTRRTRQRLGLYQGKPVRILTFRKILDHTSVQDFIHIWRRTLQEIVKNGYENNGSLLPNVCHPDFTSIQNLLGRAYPLERVQRSLLDSGEFRLKELRCSALPPFDQILRDFEKARELRLDAEDFTKQEMSDRAEALGEEERRLRKSAESALRDLLTSEDPAAEEQILTQQLRAKLTDYGYSAQSTLLELFQNADDAVSECISEQGGALCRTLEIRWDPINTNLAIFHWGRGINQTMGRDAEDPQFRIYQRDLEKMLTLNLSDKGNQQDHNLGLTGRFGLGFKSVFFLCESPRLHSNPIHCEIRGGFYPERIPVNQDPAWQQYEAMFQNLEEATVFDLPSVMQAVPMDDLLSRFEKIAPYLIRFSRALDRIKIRNGVTLTDYARLQAHGGSWTVEPLSPGDMIKILMIPDSNTPGVRASWVFHLNPEGFIPIPNDIPKIWATAPTEEPSRISTCLNGDWIPDAGRVRIARQNPENREVAQKLARRLGIALKSLLQKSTLGFPELQTQLGLSAYTDAYTFWSSFWKIITSCAPVTSWQSAVHQGQDLTSAILWCKEFGTIPGLLKTHSMIPSELPGDYRSLLRMDDIKYSFHGCLAADKEDQLTCFQLEAFRQEYPLNSIVSASVASFIKSIQDNQWEHESVGLDKVVHLYVDEFDYTTEPAELCINDVCASELGKLIHRESLKRWEETNHGEEVSRLREEILKACRFQTRAGHYAQSTELLVEDVIPGASDDIDRDERLRAAFAPADRVLDIQRFTLDGIRFFTACRGVLKADREQLAEWAQTAAMRERLAAVFRYCIEGDRGIAEGMAKELGKGWLGDHLQSKEYQSLSEEDRQSILRLFGLVKYDAANLTEDPIAGIPPYQNPQMALQAIADWWAVEKDQQLSSYLSTQYGTLPPNPLFWEDEEAFGFPEDERFLNSRTSWMLLLIHAALHTQGWTQSGHAREFVSLFSYRGWLRTLADRHSSPEDILSILDQFADQGGQEIAYYHAMREFISFYLSRLHLQGIMTGLRSIHFADAPFALSQILSINQNPHFAGAGIDAPSFVRSFGMGANFILRELYRNGKLDNSFGQEHCFVPRLRVRKLSEWLFGLPDFSQRPWREDASRTLYQKLQELAEGTLIDITFGQCYDIPLQILAQNPEILDRVIQESIEMPENDIEPISIVNE